MDIERLYQLWLRNSGDDPDLIKDLQEISDNESEKYERFYKDIEFGTAGLRGIMGAGNNRMNIYTVRRVTQGLADYLKNEYTEASVAISFDSRINSARFANEAARTLAANGIRVYITHELKPTPFLSFAVRELGCKAGIMVTASHNSSEYNGYKCYGGDGGQMTEKATKRIYQYIKDVEIFSESRTMDLNEAIEKAIVSIIGNDIYEKYINAVISRSVNPFICSECEIKVAYTPLNGTGNKPVKDVLSKIGIKDIDVVREQQDPDGTFLTCKYPNPESEQAFTLALNLASEKNSDIVIATDPDGDRIGVGVPYGSGYRLLNGNEIGIIIFNYIVSGMKARGTLPQNPVVVKTVVSSPLIKSIADEYGCTVINVLTGFKYIGEQILMLEEKDQQERFIFGFEESHGYLSGSYVRDKDAVLASMLICEAAAYYKQKGYNLLEVLNDIGKKYGFFQSKTIGFSFDGAQGMKIIDNIMKNLRLSHRYHIGENKVTCIIDYLKSSVYDIVLDKVTNITLPSSNIIEYKIEGGSNIIIRPSGTEPKVKAYIMCTGKSIEESADKIRELLSEINIMIEDMSHDAVSIG